MIPTGKKRKILQRGIDLLLPNREIIGDYVCMQKLLVYRFLDKTEHVSFE